MGITILIIVMLMRTENFVGVSSRSRAPLSGNVMRCFHHRFQLDDDDAEKLSTKSRSNTPQEICLPTQPEHLMFTRASPTQILTQFFKNEQVKVVLWHKQNQKSANQLNRKNDHSSKCGKSVRHFAIQWSTSMT
jgi:hypothetical protein